MTVPPVVGWPAALRMRPVTRAVRPLTMEMSMPATASDRRTATDCALVGFDVAGKYERTKPETSADETPPIAALTTY